MGDLPWGMRVGAIQTTAGPDRQGNLDAAAVLVDEAVAAGARLVVLPEYFSVAGSPSFLRHHAETRGGAHGDLGFGGGPAPRDPPAGRQLPRASRLVRGPGRARTGCSTPAA